MDFQVITDGVGKLVKEWQAAAKDKKLTVGEVFELADTVRNTVVDSLKVRDSVLVNL